MSQNQTGEFTQPLFWVVSIPLLASWMISTTIIPFLLNGFLPKGIREERRKHLKGNAKPHLPVFTTEIVLPRGSSIEHSSEVARDFDRFLATERGADKGDVVSWGPSSEEESHDFGSMFPRNRPDRNTSLSSSTTIEVDTPGRNNEGCKRHRTGWQNR